MRLASDTSQPRPPAWEGRQYLTIAAVLLIIALYFTYGHHLPVPGVFGDVDKRSAQTIFNEWILLAAVVSSFHLVFGVAGRFAFSTASFVGLGAFTSHYVTRTSELNWSVGLFVSMAVALVIGLGFALFVRRAQHFYFAVATLGLAEVLLLVFTRCERLTGRSSAEITGVQDMTMFGFEFDSRDRHFWVLLAFLGIVLLIITLIARSPLGRLAIAARDNPAVVETLGFDAARPGIVLFTVGCVISAAAGSLFVHTRGLGTPSTFGIHLGIGVFVALIVGGLHSMWGGLVGTWFYIYVPAYLERWEQWTQVIWGAALIVVMIAFPDGLVGLIDRVSSRLFKGQHRRAPRPGEPLRAMVEQSLDPRSSQPDAPPPPREGTPR